jgi:hypothetical protein
MPRFYGSRGKISCFGTLGRNEVARVQEVVIESDGGAPQERLSLADDTPITRTTRLIEAFNRSITHNEPTGMPAWNGLQMIRVTDAMHASSKHKVVKLQDWSNPALPTTRL